MQRMESSTHVSDSGALSGSPYLGQNLVFIISQPKAGSTLLQRILAGHPDIQTSAETWLMLHPVYALRRHGIQADYNSRWAAKGVEEFLDNYANGRETYRNGLREFARTIYGEALEQSGKRLFLDKTPRYTMIAEDLIELFPRARFVFLIRNPLAILKSELHTYVKGDWNVLASFRPDLIDAPSKVLAARDAIGEDGFVVHYESLVADPETAVRQLCEFLEIDYSDSMLDYSDTPAPKGKMNDPVGIHQHTRPSTGSVEKWKAMADDSQERAFALAYLDALGPDIIGDMGYDATELRAVMTGGGDTRQPNAVIYPWSLAIVPADRWSLKQQARHAYYTTGQRQGRMAGMLAAVGTVLTRSLVAVGRLFGIGRGGQSRKPVS